MASWSGRGGASWTSLPNVSQFSGGPGQGGGRPGGQPNIASANALGARSNQSTTAWQSGGGSHVADPEGNYIFALEIDGIEIAQFLECSGLKSSTDIFELQEGGMNGRVHKLPGQTRWDNLVLRYLSLIHI